MSYRRNVVAVITNKKGQVLFCKQRTKSRFGQWQFPQGGIEKGETPRKAVLRELREETGIKKLPILGRTKKWIKYKWPRRLMRPNEKRVGQKQIYFLFDGSKLDIRKLRPTEDFVGYRWVSWQTAFRQVVTFKRKSYRDAHKELNKIAFFK